MFFLHLIRPAKIRMISRNPIFLMRINDDWRQKFKPHFSNGGGAKMAADLVCSVSDEAHVLLGLVQRRRKEIGSFCPKRSLTQLFLAVRGGASRRFTAADDAKCKVSHRNSRRRWRRRQQSSCRRPKIESKPPLQSRYGAANRPVAPLLSCSCGCSALGRPTMG